MQPFCPKWGLGSSSLSIMWELVRNADSQDLLTCYIRVCILIRSLGALCTQESL